MAEKPKVLVVYGYHSDEEFAIDVGRSLERNPIDGVIVREFEGEPDYAGGRVKWWEPRLNRFIKRFCPQKCAVILHNEAIPIKYTSQQLDKLRKRFPDLAPIALWYYSKYEIPERINWAIVEHARAHFRYVSYLPISGYYFMPKGCDWLTIEYFPYTCSLKQVEALNHIRGLVRLLVTI